jgi:hypothetical protein
MPATTRPKVTETGALKLAVAHLVELALHGGDLFLEILKVVGLFSLAVSLFTPGVGAAPGVGKGVNMRIAFWNSSILRFACSSMAFIGVEIFIMSIGVLPMASFICSRKRSCSLANAIIDCSRKLGTTICIWSP